MDKKKVIIAIAISLIYALFVGYGIEVFNDSPERNDFCRDNLYELQDETSCEEAGGAWEGEGLRAPERPVEVKGFCGPSKECYDSYEQARTKHDKIVFIVAVIFGLAAVFAGIVLQKEAVGMGLLIGGVITIFYGTLRYWRHANDTLKFVMLGIVLAVLIWIGYKKLEDSGSSKKRKK